MYQFGLDRWDLTPKMTSRMLRAAENLEHGPYKLGTEIIVNNRSNIRNKHVPKLEGN